MRHVLLALLSFLTLPSCVTYAVDEIRPDYDGRLARFRVRDCKIIDDTDWINVDPVWCNNSDDAHLRVGEELATNKLADT